MSCFVEYDRINRGRKSIALCGDFVDPIDISNEPDCEECRRLLSQTAEDVFGAPPPRSEVRTPHIDILAGYRPRR